MKLRYGVLAVVALPVAACATDASRAPTASERAAIQAVVGQAVAARALIASSAATPDATRVLASVRFDPYRALLGSGDVGADDATAMPACAVRSEDAITFESCAIGGHSISGSVMLSSGNVVTADLTDTFDSADRQGNASVMGSVSFAAGGSRTDVLDGTFTAQAAWSQGVRAAILDATVRFDDVVLDAKGCAIGGSLTINGTLTDAAQATATRLVTFGPACGDVKIE